MAGLQFGWDPPVSGAPDSYNFYFGPASGTETLLVSVPGSQVTYTKTGAIPNSYAAFVTAVTSGVESAPSNEVNKMADTTPPAFLSGQVSADGTKVLVSLLETGTPPILPAAGVTGFGVQINGAAAVISSATSAGTVVTLTLAALILAGQIVTITYAPGNVTDSAAPPNAMLAFGAQPIANGSAVPNPTLAERATVFQGAQLALEAVPGVSPGAPAFRRLTQSQLTAVPKPDAHPYKPMGTKGVSVVQQGREVTDVALAGVLSYTELLYWLESAVKKSPPAVPVGTMAWTRTYLLDSRQAELMPQTFLVQTGSAQGAESFGYGFVKTLSLKTNDKEASLTGSLVGRTMTDNIAFSAATDVAKAPVDPSTIGIYLGDNPAALSRLLDPIETTVDLGGHWGETLYQDDTQNSITGLVEMAPTFGFKITATAKSQAYDLLRRLRAGQSIYAGLRARGAIIEGAPGAVVSQYGLDIIMPSKVTSTGRADKAGVWAHDYTLVCADDPVYGLAKIVVTTNIQTL